MATVSWSIDSIKLPLQQKNAWFNYPVVTLVYGAKDAEHNQAVVLKQWLERNAPSDQALRALIAYYTLVQDAAKLYTAAPRHYQATRGAYYRATVDRGHMHTRHGAHRHAPQR